MLQLHLSDQQFNSLLRCALRQRLDDRSLSPRAMKLSIASPPDHKCWVAYLYIMCSHWAWHCICKRFIWLYRVHHGIVVAAAARGSQDLTRRLTWGALGAKLNETATLRPYISRTKWTDNMDFATRIQKNILSQHAKSWYSRENIVLLSVVLTWHLGTCIPAKKRMPN